MAAPAPAPALMLVYDVRCSLLEEGRLLQPPVRSDAPRLVPKPKTAKPSNPPWVRAIRASGNMACLIYLVFIFAVMVPRSKDNHHLLLNCVVSVVLSLGFPAMAYTLTMDVDPVDQP
nr:uncharacterized protein LOC127323478 [Lolium perenne]